MISVTILLFSSFTGCISDEKNQENEKIEYELKISLTPKDNFQYSVLLPLPVSEDGILLDLNENIQLISGNGTYEIESSDYGKVLNVTGSGSITLISKGNNIDDLFIKGEYPKIHLSTLIDSDNDHYYYEESGDVQFRIFGNINNESNIIRLNHYFNWTHEKGHDVFSQHWVSINTDIINGWQIINGKIESESV